MLAEQNEYLKETVSGVRQLTQDEQLRQLCQAREDYEYWERIRNNYHAEQLKERDDMILQLQEQLLIQQEQFEEQQAILTAAMAKIAELEKNNA